MGKRMWFPVVAGPLAPFAAGFEAWFAAWLRSRAYSASATATANRLCQFDQLSRWLEREGFDAGELTVEHAGRFAESRRARGLVTWVSLQSLVLPLEYLRGLGVMVTPAAPVASGPVEELLADYGRYLRIERRLAEDTVRDAYLPAARLFLAGREGLDELALEWLSAAEVSMFLVAECAKRSVTGARDLASALRSFLRFLHLAGLIEAPLQWAVPSVADLRDRTLPARP
jgi:integrase/recombinase XerD